MSALVLTATGADRRIDLAWTAADGDVRAYEVRRKSLWSSVVVARLPAAILTYSDPVPNGTSHTYRIRTIYASSGLNSNDASATATSGGGTGAALTVTDGTTTVPDVVSLSLPIVTDEGGGAATARFAGPLIDVPIDIEPTDPAVVPLTINSNVTTTNDLLDIFGNATTLSVIPDGSIALGGSLGAFTSLIALNLDAGSLGDFLYIFQSGGGFPTLLRVSHGGYLGIQTHSAPADGDVQTGEAMLWFDQTNGAGKIMIKAKTADGTVVTGSVSLA